MDIKINIKNKIAELAEPARVVCGNSDYTAVFSFDEEWAAYGMKTARFVCNGRYTDVVFVGNRCPIPVMSGVTGVYIGVFAGDLHTTTPAYINCEKSILCDGGTPREPTADEYAQIMELINSGAFKGDQGEKGEKGEDGTLIKVGGEVVKTFDADTKADTTELEALAEEVGKKLDATEKGTDVTVGGKKVATFDADTKADAETINKTLEEFEKTNKAAAEASGVAYVAADTASDAVQYAAEAAVKATEAAEEVEEVKDAVVKANNTADVAVTLASDAKTLASNAVEVAQNVAEENAAFNLENGGGELSVKQKGDTKAQDKWGVALNKDTAAYGGGSFASGGTSVAGVSYETFLTLFELADTEEAKALYEAARERACDTINVATPQEAGYKYWFANAEGEKTKAIGRASHTEGAHTVAENNFAHAEGLRSKSRGEASHTEGTDTEANAPNAHAEGERVIVNGSNAHGEGYNTKANGYASHGEGYNTTATGDGAHAEGNSTIAEGSGAHAEGLSSKAIGRYSHAGGMNTEANGEASFAHGLGVIANKERQAVFGQYNIKDTEGKFAYIVGWGWSESTRRNIYTLDINGNAKFAGKVTCIDPVNKDDAATKQYVDTNIAAKLAELVNSAPATLDTLAEIAKALGNDPNFATTILAAIGKKADSATVAEELAKVNAAIPKVKPLYQHTITIRCETEGKKCYVTTTFVSIDDAPIKSYAGVYAIVAERNKITASGYSQYNDTIITELFRGNSGELIYLNGLKNFRTAETPTQLGFGLLETDGYVFYDQVTQIS